jgi:antitoxin CcdA
MANVACATREPAGENARPARRPANVSLDAALLAEARTLSINVSRACEAGLAATIKAEREARWIAENRAAMESWNDWVEEHGLPLARYRQF